MTYLKLKNQQVRTFPAYLSILTVAPPSELQSLNDQIPLCSGFIPFPSSAVESIVRTWRSGVVYSSMVELTEHLPRPPVPGGVLQNQTNWSSVPSTYVRWLINTCDTSSRFDFLFWPLHTCICVSLSTTITQINKKKFLLLKRTCRVLSYQLFFWLSLILTRRLLHSSTFKAF